MTKNFISAEKAAEWGFVSKVVPHDKLMEAAFELANEIARMPPLSISAVKKAVNRGFEGYQYAQDVVSRLRKTEDAAEGTAAFLEKRIPIFKGK